MKFSHRLILKHSAVMLIAGLVSVNLLSCDNSTPTAVPAPAENSAPIMDNSKANIRFAEGEVTVKTGVDITVKIVMRDVPVTEGGGLSLSYDASLITVSNVSVNQDVWKFVNRNGEINNAVGKVSEVLFSDYNGVAIDSDIASITLRAVKPGNATIQIIESVINPFASEGKPVTVTYGKLIVHATAD